MELKNSRLRKKNHQISTSRDKHQNSIDRETSKVEKGENRKTKKQRIEETEKGCTEKQRNKDGSFICTFDLLQPFMNCSRKPEVLFLAILSPTSYPPISFVGLFPSLSFQLPLSFHPSPQILSPIFLSHSSLTIRHHPRRSVPRSVPHPGHGPVPMSRSPSTKTLTKTFTKKGSTTPSHWQGLNQPLGWSGVGVYAWRL